jgi:hypothetical protein
MAPKEASDVVDIADIAEVRRGRGGGICWLRHCVIDGPN